MSKGNPAYAPLAASTINRVLDAVPAGIGKGVSPHLPISSSPPLPRMGVGLGVVDIKVNHIETAGEIAARIERAAQKLGAGRTPLRASRLRLLDAQAQRRRPEDGSDRKKMRPPFRHLKMKRGLARVASADDRFGIGGELVLKFIDEDAGTSSQFDDKP